MNNMNNNMNEDFEYILKNVEKIYEKLNCDKKIFEHCKEVAKLASEIAEKISRNGIKLDKKAIIFGAFLHDIGRCKTHGIEHGIVGAEIAKKLGIDEKIVRIIERHIGAGIDRNEAKKLGLPEKDYIPECLEEKIVAYADKLLYGVKRITFEEALSRFKKMLGENHSSIKRLVELHREIESLMKNNKL